MNNFIALPSGTILNLNTLAYITSDSSFSETKHAALVAVFCAGEAATPLHLALNAEDASYLCSVLERQGVNVTVLRKSISA